MLYHVAAYQLKAICYLGPHITFGIRGACVVTVALGVPQCHNTWGVVLIKSVGVGGDWHNPLAKPVSYITLRWRTVLVGRHYTRLCPGLKLIPAWWDDYIHYKVWVKTTNPFVEVWEWTIKYFHPAFYRTCNYLFLLGLTIMHVVKSV